MSKHTKHPFAKTKAAQRVNSGVQIIRGEFYHRGRQKIRRTFREIEGRCAKADYLFDRPWWMAYCFSKGWVLK